MPPGTQGPYPPLRLENVTLIAPPVWPWYPCINPTTSKRPVNIFATFRATSVDSPPVLRRSTF